MLTGVFALVAASTVFLDYWEYSHEFHAEPEIWNSTLRGVSAAPEQYRIGVLKAAYWLTQHSPLAMRHALTLFDLISVLVAFFALRSVLTHSRTWQASSTAVRWFGAAVLIFLLEYSLHWLTWYHRPETLAIAALLAVSFWICTTAQPNPALAALGLIVLALMLGSIRADAAVMFHLGMALICLTPLSRSFALSRWIQMAASLASIAAAGSVQLYIMRVLYPFAIYGSTPKIQALLNITDHIRVVPFVLFLTPSVWAVVQIRREKLALPAAQAGLLVGSGLFIILWCVVGKIDEVRIFLPFAFLMSPLVAEVAMQRVGAEFSLRSNGVREAL